jgi:hypothetical protein
MEKLTFAKRVKLAEKRLGLKLPITYVKFIKDFEGVENLSDKGSGKWLTLEELGNGNDFNIDIDDSTDAIRKKLVVVYTNSTNDRLVIDTRPINDGSYGTIIYPGDPETDSVDIQYYNFEEFLDSEGRLDENNKLCFDYFSWG